MPQPHHPDHEDIPHPSIETRSRFPKDDALRAKGFAIFDRRKGLPARWRDRDGLIWLENEALELIGWKKTPPNR